MWDLGGRILAHLVRTWVTTATLMVRKACTYYRSSGRNTDASAGTGSDIRLDNALRVPSTTMTSTHANARLARRLNARSSVWTSPGRRNSRVDVLLRAIAHPCISK